VSRSLFTPEFGSDNRYYETFEQSLDNIAAMERIPVLMLLSFLSDRPNEASDHKPHQKEIRSAEKNAPGLAKTL